MTYEALDAVSAAIYAALSAPAVTALATGGVSDDPAQGTAFPFVWFEVRMTNFGGLGGGELREVEVLTHTFTKGVGPRPAQQLDAKVQGQLTDQQLAIAGYEHCASVFYDDTVSVPVSELNGEKVHEVVSSFRLVVQGA